MNEKLLDALMELFAIIAGIEGIKEKGRSVVQVFLRQWVTLDAVDKYVSLFDHFVQKHEEEKPATPGRKRKRTSVRDSVKALVICQQINAELTQEQKFVILIRLLEFINADKEISDAEFEFVSTVALAFNIDESEFMLITDYIIKNDFFYTLEKGFYEKQYQNVLILRGDEKINNKDIKIMMSDNFTGELVFIRIKSIEIYLVKYIGEDEMYLNGQICNQNRVYLFPNGSTMRNPRISPIYYSDIVAHFLSESEHSKISFVAENVHYQFKTGKFGLRNINVIEESGKLIGFMGASGAGKTTLLNVLCGIETPSSGKVTINGIDIHREKDQIEGVVGYVSQDDLLIEELTVYQNLYYNAKLCFGNLAEEELDTQVSKVLKNLGLSEIRDLIVGSPLNKKISGGQRKRLNIALELIREPSVLFVDEPTSGLSSRDSENIMDLLKELSLKGKLVFVVIHQPSSDIYKMFDKLLIMDTGGYPVYYGNPIEAVLYFRKITNHVNADKSECVECGNVNPEQIFNIIEAKVVDEYGNFTDKRKISPTQWYDFFQEEINLQKPQTVTTVPQSTLNIPSKFRQWLVFITRDVLSKVSNVQYMIINFLEAPLLAFILAYLVRFFNTDELTGENTYFFSENENLVAYLFMSIVVALFMGLTVSAEEIIKDRKILKRESFLNLSKSSYLFSKLSILFSISAIQMASYVVLGNLILDIRDMHFDYWLVLFSTACFANLLGLNISSAFNSAVTIYILIPILLIPQLLLSGAIVKFDKLNPAIMSDTHVPLAGDLMASKWAFEALAVNQYKNNKYEKKLFPYEKAMSNAEYKKNYLIPELQSKNDFCDNNYTSKNDSLLKIVYKDIGILRREIARLDNKNIFTDIEKLTPETFNAKLAGSVRIFLKRKKKAYIGIWNRENRRRDKYISSLQDTPEKKAAYRLLKKQYHNENLENLVRNSRNPDNIIERNALLIQKLEPVYKDPSLITNAFDFRAHFFAPRKHFFGNLYDTFYFNIMILWVMTLTLYITLYFNILKHVLNLGTLVADFVKEKYGKGLKE